MLSQILPIIAKYCISPVLTLGIIQTETNFRNVISGEGSVGLMQIKPTTAQMIGCEADTKKKLMDIEKNIKCGCRYLNMQNLRYQGDVKQIIASYNAGSAIICRDGTTKNGTCVVGEFINQNYVEKVTKNMFDFRRFDILY